MNIFKLATLVSALGLPVLVADLAHAQVSCNLVPGYTYCDGASTTVNAIAVIGESTQSTGVLGISTDQNGVQGNSAASGQSGVYGQNTGGGYGVYGVGATGVHGTSSSANGVEGFCSNGGSGVYGEFDGSGGIGVAGRIQPAGDGVAVYGDNTSTSGWSGYFTGRVAIQGTPTANQSTFTLFNSDARLKKNIMPLRDGLEKLLQLRGVTYEWKEPENHGNATGPQRGFIAQEVEKVFPDWVGRNSDGYRNLTLRGFEPIVVESIRTLKSENDELRDRVKALEAGRGHLTSGFGGDSIGFGMIAIAGSVLFASSRRKRTEARS